MNDNLLNVDIITPSDDIVKLIGKVSKLNIFEFSGSQEFEPEGLFSTKIFGGIGSTARNETLGYIDLGIKILHPLVYDYLTSLNSHYTSIIKGTTKVRFENGGFVEDEDGNNGLYFFLKHLPNLALSDNGSDQRKSKIDTISGYSDKKHLSRYVLVLPAGLRDYTVKENGVPSEDDINNMYRSLVSVSNTIKNLNIDLDSEDAELYNSIFITLHEGFLKIYNYIKNILEGKTGHIQNNWIKRGIKYGSRNVITPSTNLVKNLLSENKISNTDTVIGLHQYIAGISPIAKRKIVEMLSPVFDAEATKAYLYNAKTFMPELTDLKQKDKKDWVTYEGLDGLIEKFGQDAYKFLPVKISGKYLGLVRDDGVNITLHFNTEVEIDKYVRPITYIELLYMAIYDIRNKYPGILTRFPVDGMKSTYLTTFYLKVTTEDRDVNYTFNGETKKMFNYPILNKKSFNALSPHYTRLDGIGGDFDGDMVSIFILMDDGSITETLETLDSVMYNLNPNGGLMSSVSVIPSETLLAHLTDTMSSDTFIFTLQDAVDNIGESKVESYLTKNNVEKEDNFIYIALDKNENIIGHFSYVLYFKYGVEKSLLPVIKYINTEYFILINTLSFKNANVGHEIMSYIDKTVATSYDTIMLGEADMSIYGYSKPTPNSKINIKSN